MPKVTRYLYADFETTKVELPEQYENYKDYYEQSPKPEYPQVYSWSVLYGKEYQAVPNYNLTEGETLNDKYVHNYGINGKSFIEYVESLDFDAIMYFNNLRGFDGHFIVPLLDKMGYYNVMPFDIENYIELSPEQKMVIKQRVAKITMTLFKNEKTKEKYNNLAKLGEDKAERYLLSLIKKNWSLLAPKEYSLITNGNSKIFEIKIGIKDSKRTKDKVRNRALIIRDNLNLFPSSVKAMGHTILLDYLKHEYLDKGLLDTRVVSEFKDLEKYLEATSPKTYKFLADKFFKKDISGGYNRSKLYKNIKELQEDGNELEYLVQDTYILWKYHKVIEQHFPRKQWKMTIGSTSYKLWQESFGDNLLDSVYYEDVYLKRGTKRIKYQGKLYTTMDIKKKLVNDLLPTKWMMSKISKTETKYDLLYKYYFGGMTFTNEDFRGQLVKNITFVDINSSYPAQMVKDVQVPWGRGLSGDVKTHKFKFYKLTPKKKIYNKTGLPFLHNTRAEKREYLRCLKPGTEYRFTSITLPRFIEYYKCSPDDYELEIEFSFTSMSLKDIFGDFITYWYDIKENSAKEGNVILKFIAKLFMNNVYGKLATKLLRDSKIWNQDSSEWESYEQKLDPEYYLPLGIVITELGRMQLVDGVGHMYKKVAYGDTDSVGILDYKESEFPNIDLHPTKIGKWDIEFKNGNGIFRRPKQYMLLNDHKRKMAFSGINFDRFLLSDIEIKDLEAEEKIYRTLSLKDFILGKTIDKQLKPHRLLGSGLILEDLTKDIKPVWDYEPLTEQIYYKREHFIHNLKNIDTLSRNTI